jgi:hypothetical protein
MPTFSSAPSLPVFPVVLRNAAFTDRVVDLKEDKPGNPIIGFQADFGQNQKVCMRSYGNHLVDWLISYKTQWTLTVLGITNHYVISTIDSNGNIAYAITAPPAPVSQ